MTETTKWDIKILFMLIGWNLGLAYIPINWIALIVFFLPPMFLLKRLPSE